MVELLNQIEPWHWWVLAALLIAGEILAPSTVLLWPGIAAGVVGIVMLVAGPIGWEYQVLLFAALSVASLYGWRVYARRHPATAEGPELNRRGRQYIGRTFTLAEPISDGRGKLRIDDTIWTIAGEDLPAGAHVRVVDMEAAVLKVEKA